MTETAYENLPKRPIFAKLLLPFLQRFSEIISRERNLIHLLCTIPLVHGHREIRLSAIQFSRINPPDIPSSTPTIYNTPVNLYLMLKVNISKWDHSKVYPESIIGDSRTKGELTRRCTRSVVICDIVEGVAGHCKVLRACKHPTAKPELSPGDETDLCRS
jgi:hypothetical protein